MLLTFSPNQKNQKIYNNVHIYIHEISTIFYQIFYLTRDQHLITTNFSLDPVCPIYCWHHHIHHKIMGTIHIYLLVTLHRYLQFICNHPIFWLLRVFPIDNLGSLKGAVRRQLGSQTVIITNNISFCKTNNKSILFS